MNKEKYKKLKKELDILLAEVGLLLEQTKELQDKTDKKMERVKELYREFEAEIPK